jgi:nucleoside-diphosphate-sugar epimerase
MARAVVLGGTGQVGRAVARRLLRAGWKVTLTGRDETKMPAELREEGVVFVPGDRSDPAHLAAVLERGADLLVDNVCYTAEQARALTPLLGEVGSTVMLSSKAVYVDDEGRHSNSDDPPRFAGPIRETQPTMAPGDMPYDSREGYGANKVAAEQVFLDSGRPVTIIRPSKVHGEGAQNPREWYFVKRVLDRRPAVLLARRGAGTDHPTAAANIAALVEVAAAKPGARILNSADPDAPNGLEIARTIARHLGHEWDEVLLDEDGPLGRHPWDRLPPIVLDTTAATELGYVPAGNYASTVAGLADWLVANPPSPDGPFDYAAEDAYLSAIGLPTTSASRNSGSTVA